MANAAASLDGSRDPFRESILAAAQRFKSNWVELGKLLVRVQGEALYQQWGYPSFEAYCAKEVRIRRATALKLTRGYSFIERHEQARNEEERIQRAPPFEVIEVLANAEERGQLSGREYEKIRDSIWQPDRSGSELRRELESRFPRPKPDTTEDLQLRRLSNTAKRLALDLRACSRVPAGAIRRSEELAQELGILAAGNGK